ncbi:MAG: molecular chaperone TorD family protein [Acidimicrobiales bacterium]
MTTVPAATAANTSPPHARWELIRALAAVCDTPIAAASATSALGLGQVTGDQHTQVFVLSCPPHAAIHLGAEGKLGGEAQDRVAGFWRAIGLDPGTEPDHLSSLLSLYAHLGESAGSARRPDTRGTVERIRQALLWEHLWAWVPGYTRAVEQLDVPAISAWARLTRQVLASEYQAGVGPAADRLPLALRDAPPPIRSDSEPSDLLDALVAPARSGIVLTREALAAAAGQIGVGYRIGERRFALRAMLEQDPAATLVCLRNQARGWAVRHHRSSQDTCSQWWAARARRTVTVLAELTVTAGNGVASADQRSVL